MKSIAVIAAALISAGAVNAEGISPGHAQFAATLNLDAAQYSLEELSNIQAARRDNDVNAERFYLTGASRENRGGVGQVSPGKAQLAAPLGVNAAEYSLAELIALTEARSENDTHAEAFILSRQNHVNRGGVGEVSHGKAQLAAGLGVNAAEYSLSELVALSVERHGDGD